MTTKHASFLEHYFYLFMSLLIAVVVVFGFSHTIDRLIHPRIQPPAILYLHSFVFSAWVLFFILQSALVRSRNVRLHRTLGWVGVGLGISIVVLGWMTSIIMGRLLIQHGGPLLFLKSFLIITPLDMLSFGISFALAIYWRRRPDFHRRLMLIASCTLLEAAFGRIPIFHLFLAPVGLDALILLGVVRDIIVDRRIHKVYLYALPTLIVFQIFAEYTLVHQSPWWIHIADYLLR